MNDVGDQTILSKVERLRLYELAVQSPQAELHFMLRVFDYYWGHTGVLPLLLCEDFCGTAAVARHWVDFFEQHQAVGIDIDPACIEMARVLADEKIPDRSEDLHLMTNDIFQVDMPGTDLIVALNFSVLIFHDWQRLVSYFKNALRRLNAQGVFIMDVFDGPGSRQVLTQRRQIRWEFANQDDLSTLRRFETYIWEQHSYEAVSKKIDCRIHFEDLNGQLDRHAFRYDWCLWSPQELQKAILAAGFRQCEIWSYAEDGYWPTAYPIQTDSMVDDAVFYLVATN